MELLDTGCLRLVEGAVHPAKSSRCRLAQVLHSVAAGARGHGCPEPLDLAEGDVFPRAAPEECVVALVQNSGGALPDSSEDGLAKSGAGGIISASGPKQLAALARMERSFERLGSPPCMGGVRSKLHCLEAEGGQRFHKEVDGCMLAVALGAEPSANGHLCVVPGDRCIFAGSEAAHMAPLGAVDAARASFPKASGRTGSAIAWSFLAGLDMHRGGMEAACGVCDDYAHPSPA
mmetsp:Transcript_64542/g.154180  ORF Transcript_64542/g.154180 Transcript_64542/m.154180 type:complete len:233 (+) Transcript_64542:763-1461(+)